MEYQKVYTFIIDRLEKELPSSLSYHNVQHTKDVVDAVQYICESEKISGNDTELVLTAAAFHDTGFLKGYENHEASSCDIARDVLPKFNYDKDEVEKICKLISVTKLPQTPVNHLQEILCDADLFYLGSDKYFEGAEQLHHEFKEAGKIDDNIDWNKVQIDFLKKHRYFTLTAIKERDKKKKENFQHLLIKQELEKTLKKNRHPMYSHLRDFFLIIIGILIAGFALKGFLVPNHFFDGGVTGISLLLTELYHLNLAYIIVLANLPFIILSYFTVSKRFAIKTFGCIVLLGICLWLLPYPVITSDKLLISIFGGFFSGLGIGLIMRAGCALDGVEVLALYTFKKTSFTVTEIILAINIAIFSIAAIKLGMEIAMYSVLTYFTATKTIDFVVEGIEAYIGITIISGKSELIKYRLVNELSSGITVYKGERGYLPGQFESYSDCDIIFTVVTRLELRKLKNVLHEIDPKAFVFASPIKEASGGILTRKLVH
ncbi:MAG: YitT family protein [Chitinophagaceae bacterium]